MDISKKIQQIKPSATFAIAAKAREMRSQGIDIISLSQGEPDFDTPTPIKNAAIQAINDGFTKYTPVDGIVELKKAIQDKFMHDNSLEYDLDSILVSSGAKQSIFNALFSMLNNGDEVILVAPYWVSYPEMVKMADGIPVTITTNRENSFKIMPNDLANAISSKTKLVMLNSPSNPTGACYSKKELQQLGEILRQYPDIYIISDDIYEHTTWDGNFSNLAMACPDLQDRVIVINGVSKAYAMTGWRIGYAAGNKEIIAAMKKVQSQSTSSPNSIAQKATTAALRLPNSSIATMVTEFQKRHDWLYPALQKIPGVKVNASLGTFYSFPDISDIINNSHFKDDVEFCEQLLQNGHVAIVPGSAFGAPNHIRLSFAASLEHIKPAISAIEKFINSI